MQQFIPLSDLEIRYVLITMSFLMDLIFGDPVYPFHPIRILGNWILILQKSLFKVKLNGYFGGTILWFGTIMLPTIVYLLLRYFVENTLILILIDLFIFYSLFSAGDLIKHVNDVYNALLNSEIGYGREAVALIVGRGTEHLNKSEISKAAVETLAENSSDGIIAPLFYALCFGPIGIIIYKCVNTLDSMVGYRNEKYLRFGFVSAKMDDLCNFIPARITALLILLHHAFNPKEFKIFWSYRNAHLSPNAGFPESAMASILNVKMGGPSEYHGKIVDKEYINPDGKNMQPDDIKRSIKVIWYRCMIIFIFLIFLSLITLQWNFK